MAAGRHHPASKVARGTDDVIAADYPVGRSNHGRSASGGAASSAVQKERKALPIASAEQRLVEEVHANSTLVVIGETGSGKTTQLPQFLQAAGLCCQGLMIGVTQPRRVAAVTVAQRVAMELGTPLGARVGYSIRFEDACSHATEIKYMTDGMLLREALLDPLLLRYSVLVVDEAHERTLHTDVLLGLLKEVQERRMKLHAEATAAKAGQTAAVPTGGAAKKGHSRAAQKAASAARQCAMSDQSGQNNGHEDNGGPVAEKLPPPLKLVVMSATLDAQGFCSYFQGAKAVYVQGRQYPVEILYTKAPEADYLDAALLTTLQIHLEEPPGDILVFLTGQEEIEAMERLLKERASKLPPESAGGELVVAPIYAAMPSEQQMRVFQQVPAGARKVVLATNIAETSLTIPGIRYVVDPGLVKARGFNPKTGIESLSVVPISKAQARQRSGRAGREAAGRCYRLYTEAAFDGLEDVTVPEIRRCNLAGVALQLKAMGIHDVLAFDFMDKPPRAAVVKALEHLYTLGALTEQGKLSDPVGVQMARFPLEPLYSRAVLTAASLGCTEEMLVCVAMLSVEGVFFAPKEKRAEAAAARKRFESAEGDHLTLLQVFRAYSQEAPKSQPGKRDPVAAWCHTNFVNGRAMRKAADVHGQLRGHCVAMGLPVHSCKEDWTAFRRCLAGAFFVNAARKQPDGTYRAIASGQTVSIHPSSVLFGQKPGCVVFNELVRTNKQYIRDLTRIDPLWLPELAPQFYALKDAQAAKRQYP